MRKFGSIRVLCALALLASASVLTAQTTAPNPDPAITSLSVMGVVTDLKPDTRQVIVKTAAGNVVTVTLSDRTTFMRIPPGEKNEGQVCPDCSDGFRCGRHRLRARKDDGGSEEHARARVLRDEPDRHREEAGA